jgi:hypothetical protein
VQREKKINHKVQDGHNHEIITHKVPCINPHDLGNNGIKKRTTTITYRFLILNTENETNTAEQ